MTTYAAKYRRISDDDEGQELGVTRQDQDLNALAAHKGYAIFDDYCDNDISASTRSKKRRPNYERMIRDAKAGKFKVILAYTSARLTRRPRELEDLIELSERHGVRIEYVKSPSFDLNTADGRNVARILAANDAAESERISERVSRTYVQRISSGGNGGGPRAYGFEPDGTTLRAAECAVISDAAHKVLRGASLRALARDLRAAGVPTATGGHWTPELLRGVLVRPRNAGRIVLHGEVIGKASWDPIVPPDVHDQVVRILTNPNRDTRAGTAPRWLLSGIATCGICNDGTSVEVTMGGRNPRYRCKKSGHLTRNAQHTNEWVRDVLLAWIVRDAAHLLIPTRPDVDVAGLRAERDAIEANLAAIGGDVVLGLLTRAAAHEATRVGRARITEIEAQLASAAGPDPDLAELVASADPVGTWEGLPLENKRLVLKKLVNVTLLPSTRRGRGFDEDSVRIEPRT